MLLVQLWLGCKYLGKVRVCNSNVKYLKSYYIDKVLYVYHIFHHHFYEYGINDTCICIYIHHYVCIYVYAYIHIYIIISFAYVSLLNYMTMWILHVDIKMLMMCFHICKKVGWKWTKLKRTMFVNTNPGWTHITCTLNFLKRINSFSKIELK